MNTQADAQNVPATDSDQLNWRRVHPATPFLDVGLGLIALIVALVSTSIGEIQDAIELFMLAREHGVLDFIVQNLAWLLGACSF